MLTYFCTAIVRDMIDDIQEIKDKDLQYNWVASSRFLFYVVVFCLVSWMVGACYELYKHRWKGKPDVEVPGNTLYTPEYK